MSARRVISDGSSGSSGALGTDYTESALTGGLSYSF